LPFWREQHLDQNQYEAKVYRYWQKQAEVLGEKPVQVPLYRTFNMDCSEIEPWLCSGRPWEINLTFLHLKTQFVPRSKHFVPITKTNHLCCRPIYRDNPFCSDIRTRYINAFCAQTVQFSYVKPGGTWSNHWDLEWQECTTVHPTA
jgi:hypothetical protein